MMLFKSAARVFSIDKVGTNVNNFLVSQTLSHPQVVSDVCGDGCLITVLPRDSLLRSLSSWLLVFELMNAFSSTAYGCTAPSR